MSPQERVSGLVLHHEQQQGGCCFRVVENLGDFKEYLALTFNWTVIMAGNRSGVKSERDSTLFRGIITLNMTC